MKTLLCLLILLLPMAINAALPPEPVPADQAFQFSATAKDNQTVVGIWKIAPGYYLYRNRIHFSPVKPQQDRLGQPILPDTTTVKDYPGLGKMPVYTGDLQIAVPVIQNSGNTIAIKVHYQGCADQGYCYPPTTKIVQVNLAGNYMIPVQPMTIDIATPSKIPSSSPPPEQNKVTQLLQDKSIVAIILGFLGFGLLLSLTPCVLPMIPILSSILAGQKKHHHARAFSLSLAYVLGMAITYAIAGVIFGFIGGSVQAIFQQPWIIVLYSLIFVAMALSLFGLYNIKLPEKLNHRLIAWSNKQQTGSYFGVFIMGCLSTLILSPCVTAPLVGVLGYISQTGNAALGGLALFVMGLGMGVPLLIIGASSTKLLPKVGTWMNSIKLFLGFLMLAVAIWMLSRLLPSIATMLLWGALAIGFSVTLGAFSTAISTWRKFTKTLGILVFVYGIMLVVGGITGNTNPLTPFHIARNSSQHSTQQFIPVKTVADVNQQLQQAQSQQQVTLLDFYADWCMSCKEMEHFTFGNPAVQAALKHIRLLRADVTQNSPQNKMLQAHFGVVAPPTIIFFDAHGKEIKNSRIVGEMSAKKFLQHLKAL